MSQAESAIINTDSFGHLAASKHVEVREGDLSLTETLLAIRIQTDKSVDYRPLMKDARLRLGIQEPVPNYETRRPRLLETQVPIWQQGGDDEGGLLSFRMKLPRDGLSGLQSLAEYRKKFVEDEPNSEQREVLDVIAQVLFGLARVFHQKGRTIGLLDPGNVLFYECGAAIRVPKSDNSGAPPSCPQIQVVLPDLCFFPSDSESTAPSWFQCREEFFFLWGDPEEAHGMEERGRLMREWLTAQQNKLDKRKDLSALVRMLGWLLTGKELYAIPDRIDLLNPCWEPMRGILTGEAPDAEAAAESLAEVPMQGEVQSTAVPRDERRDRGQFPVFAGVLLGLLILAAAGFYFWDDIRDSVVPPPAAPVQLYPECPDCPPESGLHELFNSSLTPLITDFHGEDRYPYPVDEVPMSQITEEIVKSQEQLLELQVGVVEEAHKLLGEDAGDDQESECFQHVVGACLERIAQHYDVISDRKISPGVTRGKIVRLAVFLRRIEKVVEKERAPEILNSAGDIFSRLRSDGQTKNMWTMYSSGTHLEDYFRLASLLQTEERARSFLVSHVKGYDLYKDRIEDQ
ncbi:MAG: hypothetical protein ABGZ35_11935 [Planctomycetaceae bacterium]